MIILDTKTNVSPSHILHLLKKKISWVRIIVFYVTFNNISAILWQLVLLVKETGVPGENHQPVTCQ